MPTFALVENADILAAVAALPKAPFCVGFAAESGDVLANASAKRLKKNVPLIVGNLGPATFGQDDNALTLVDARGVRELPRAGKLALARQLVAEIAARLGARDRAAHERRQREDPRRRAHPRSAHRRSAAGLRHGRQRRARPARLHRRAARPRARRRRADPDRPGDPPRRSRLRGDAAAALRARPQARHRPRQPGRPDRLRLPGPADGELLEPRRERVHDRAVRAHRPAGDRAGRAGRVPRRRHRSTRASAARPASARPGAADPQSGHGRAGSRGRGRGIGIRASPTATVAVAPAFDRARFRRLFVAVMVPMFLAAVDQTLLATATPVISRELGGLRDTSWLAVAYLLASVDHGAALRTPRRPLRPAQGALGRDRRLRARLARLRRGADARPAGRRARPAGRRRRRPDDAVAGAHRRGRRAAAARPQPELLRDHLHARQRRRAGHRRPRRPSRELALALPRQPAALRARGLAPAHDARRRSPASCARQARCAPASSCSRSPRRPRLVWLSSAGHRFAWASATSVVLLACGARARRRAGARRAARRAAVPADRAARACRPCATRC